MLREVDIQIQRVLRDGNSPVSYWDRISTVILPESDYPPYLNRIAKQQFKEIEKVLKLNIPQQWQVRQMVGLIALSGSEVLSTLLTPEHQAHLDITPPKKLVILTDPVNERANGAWCMTVNFSLIGSVQTGQQIFEGSIVMPDYAKEHRMPLDLLSVGLPTAQVLDADRHFYDPPERSLSENDFINMSGKLGYTPLFDTFIQIIRKIGTNVYLR